MLVRKVYLYFYVLFRIIQKQWLERIFYSKKGCDNNQAIEYSLPIFKVIAIAVDKKVQNMRIGSMIIKQIL